MNRFFRLAIFIIFTNLVAVPLYAQLRPSIVEKQDDVLWYTKPAMKWTDALPLGNGRIGAMVFGGPDKDRIQFNEETLWSGGPRDYNKAGAATYLPEIRKLIQEGRQAEAEKLGDAHFMGLESKAGDKKVWIAAMRKRKGMKGDPASLTEDDSSWKSIPVPTYEGWETEGLEGLDGALWFRTAFTLPASYAGKDLILDLNKVRDQDFTYINGTLVGATEGVAARKYVIPSKLLRKGKNVLAIQVLNYFDKGGIAGYKDTTKHITIYPGRNGIAEKDVKAISLNGLWKYKVQDSEPPAVPHFQADYQPFGDLVLDFGELGKVKDYRRELALNTAVAKTSYSLNGVNYRREYFVSAPQKTMVIRLSADKRAKINFSAALGSPHKQVAVRKINGNTIAMSVQPRDGVLKGESFLKAVVDEGRVSVDKDGRLVVANATAVTLYLAAATNFIDYKTVTGRPDLIGKAVIDDLKDKSFEKVKQEHIKEYQQYYHAFSLRFGEGGERNMPTDLRLANFSKGSDPSFAALYVQYGRYLLISSSRPGTQPANLQGIWNDQLAPPWGSKYTTNINVEMNYWPSEVLNLSAMHEPMFKMIAELAEQGRITAKTYYDAAGWVLHHNTDIWRATAPINSATHGIWVTGAAWLTMDLWEHYQFTQDKQFLKEQAYPLMKSAAQFFNDFLVRDPKTGWLISTPSNSPEHGGLVAGPTMDHQIIRTLFKNCIAAAAILNTDTAFSKTLKEKYSQIAPNQIGRHQQLQEWLEDKDDVEDKHRHVSHLWGVHPGNDITWEDQPELMKAARQSLLYRGDEGTGWSLAWKINFWARFREGDHAMKMVQMLMRPAGNAGGSYLNLFDAHPPFQIDGNFGGAAGIAEMLLQSHTRYIDILPALPAAIPAGELNGICARGGFVLNIRWKNNELENLEIWSAKGGSCMLRYKGKVVAVTARPGQVYQFNHALLQL